MIGNITPSGAAPARSEHDDQDYRAAMRDAIAIQWAAVWKAMPGVVAGDDPEAVHDVRVASRRLRAAMDVATDCFATKWYRPLHKTAKAITQALGEVRDRDVLLEELGRSRQRASEAEQPGIDYLIAGIERDRKKARKRMLAFLAGLDAKGIPEETARRFPLAKKARTDGGPGAPSKTPRQVTEVQP